MSSFIVEDKSISAIINFLQSDEDAYKGEPLRELAALGFNLDDFSETADADKRLGQAMLDLNCEAFNTRYPTAKSPGETYHHHFAAKKPTRVQTLKHIQCWLYQCSEGDKVPAMPLFKAFETIQLHLLKRIVMSLPEYDTAKWS